MNINKEELINFDDLSLLFKMFSDPTRLKILNQLFDNELCVSNLAQNLKMTHSAISHQLSLLKINRLVKSRKDGKEVYYSLNDQHVAAIFEIAYEHINHD